LSGPLPARVLAARAKIAIGYSSSINMTGAEFGLTIYGSLDLNPSLNLSARINDVYTGTRLRSYARDAVVGICTEG
jgi:hypothetical protein